jgi:hypothetical protein
VFVVCIHKFIVLSCLVVPLLVSNTVKTVLNMGNAPVSAPSVVCERCEQQKQKAAEKQDDVLVGTACSELYETVQKCMTLHQGNIADCRKEWDGFRKCYGKEKK